MDLTGPDGYTNETYDRRKENSYRGTYVIWSTESSDTVLWIKPTWSPSSSSRSTAWWTRLTRINPRSVQWRCASCMGSLVMCSLLWSTIGSACCTFVATPTYGINMSSGTDSLRTATSLQMGTIGTQTQELTVKWTNWLSRRRQQFTVIRRRRRIGSFRRTTYWRLPEDNAQSEEDHPMDNWAVAQVPLFCLRCFRLVGGISSHCIRVFRFLTKTNQKVAPFENTNKKSNHTRPVFPMGVDWVGFFECHHHKLNQMFFKTDSFTYRNLVTTSPSSKWSGWQSILRL